MNPQTKISQQPPMDFGGNAGAAANPATTPTPAPAPAASSKVTAPKASAATGKSTSAPVPVAPAIPQVLVEAGLSACFSAPRKAFLAAGGTDVEFAREVNFAMQLMMRSEYLIKCAKNYPDYLIEAIKAVGLTKLSLNPELKLAYLVPRKGKIYFAPSYMGKREILMRAGIVQWIEANLVYEGDVFRVRKGTVNELIHEPEYFGENHTRDKIKGGYWTACLPNGKVVFDVIPMSRILEIQQRSDAVQSGNGSPWSTDFEKMARKSFINDAYSQLPKTGISESMIQVLEIANKYDNDEFDDWKKAQEQAAAGKPDSFDRDGSFVQYEEVK